MHHLIDPRTGRPSQSDLHTVTVLAPTAVEAEVAAKVALILGRRAGRRYLEQRGLSGVLLIQLLPIGKDHTNPPVVQEPNWDSPQTRELAMAACGDCHSTDGLAGLQQDRSHLVGHRQSCRRRPQQVQLQRSKPPARV